VMPGLRALPPSGRTLAGFTYLSEFLSVRRSDTLVRRSLHVVSTTTRCSAVRPVRTQAPERLPQVWPPSQGTSLTAGREPLGPRRPLLGFWRPFSDMGDRVRFSRACLTRHVPSSEFLTPSTGFSPATLRSRGPLPLVGFCRLVAAFRPGCHGASRCRAVPRRVPCSVATRSHALRTTGPSASLRRTHRLTFRRRSAPTNGCLPPAPSRTPLRNQCSRFAAAVSAEAKTAVRPSASSAVRRRSAFLRPPLAAATRRSESRDHEDPGFSWGYCIDQALLAPPDARCPAQCRHIDGTGGSPGPKPPRQSRDSGT